MGFIAGLFLVGLTAYGLWLYATDSAARRKFHAEFLQAPIRTIVTLAGVSFFMLFFFGIFVPVPGTIQVQIGSIKFELWQIGGLGTLAFGVFLFSRFGSS